jgi:hypothetical protein
MREGRLAAARQRPLPRPWPWPHTSSARTTLAKACAEALTSASTRAGRRASVDSTIEKKMMTDDGTRAPLGVHGCPVTQCQGKAGDVESRARYLSKGKRSPRPDAVVFFYCHTVRADGRAQFWESALPRSRRPPSSCHTHTELRNKICAPPTHERGLPRTPCRWLRRSPARPGEPARRPGCCQRQ